MTNDIRLESFLRSCTVKEDLYLVALRKEAEAEGVPIIRREEEAILQFFASEEETRKVLEIGTGTGYSGILMLKALPEEACLTTVELDPERKKKAEKHFEEAGFLSRVTIVNGDMKEVLKTLPDASFDLIFQDSAKGQYLHVLPEMLRVLSPGGVLLTDNLFFEGVLLDPKSLTVRRDRTIHDKLRAYLQAVLESPELTSMLIPLGDGMLVSRKKVDQ